MSLLPSTGFETIAPSASDRLLALKFLGALESHKLPKKKPIRLRLPDVKTPALDVPAPAFQLFIQLLTELSQGHAVSLIPNQTELRTQEAADLLNVSRPYLVKLLDDGQIPSRKVGEQRRVRLDDLLVYKRKDDAEREKVLAALAADAQEQGLGY